MNAVLDYFQLTPGLAWIAVGVLLVIVEILSPAGFFLSFAAAAVIVALKTWLFGANMLVDVLIFSIVGMVLIVPLRALLRRFADGTKDINEL